MPVGPQRLERLLARQRALPVGGEEGEEQPALAPGQPVLDAATVHGEREAAAELDTRRRQARAKITPTPPAYNRRDTTKGGVVAKQITCECGQVIRGETDDDVVEGAREHMRSDHPEMYEKVTRDDLLGWIEEV